MRSERRAPLGKGDKGQLIALEGIDGAGKSTQAKLLAEALRRAGRVVTITREPTDGPHGAKIRRLSSEGAALSPDEELAFFIEDRGEHVRDVIAPALARGEVVITDRYYLSNVAYQGARGLSPESILQRNEALFPPPAPAILLQTSADLGLERVRSRGGALNQAYEHEAFLERVAAIYAELQCDYLVRVVAEGPPEAVHISVMGALAQWGAGA